MIKKGETDYKLFISQEWLFWGIDSYLVVHEIKFARPNPPLYLRLRWLILR